MANYIDEWNAAVNRTRKFGLDVPPYEPAINKLWLDANAHARFPYVVRDAIGEVPPEEIGLQCMSIHYRLQSVVQDWLGCPALYTIGWIDDETPTGMFRFDDAFIQDRLDNGHPSSQVNLHTWLTLPSMEVIDVSLATSIALVQKKPALMGGVIAQLSDGLKGMKYKPMLVGSDFIFKTSLLKKVTIFETD